MRTRCGLVGVLVVLALLTPTVAQARLEDQATAAVSAARPGSSCAKPLSWSKAKQAIGRWAAIRGRVVRTYYARSSSGSPTFLNFHDPYPGYFTVVIWGGSRAAFGGSPESRYLRRVVCATGVVQNYRGTPQIIARRASQLRIVG